MPRRKELAPAGSPEAPLHAGDRYDPRPGMNRAWEQVATMTAAGAVEAAYTVAGIEYIEVAKLKPGHSGGVKVGEFRPGDPNPDDLEQYVLRSWGPGVYNLSPIWRNHRIRTRSFPFGGEAAFANAVSETASGNELDNVDKQLADHVRRRSAAATLRELHAMEMKEEDMTPEQLKDVLTTVVTAARPAAGSDPLVAVLQQQNQFMMEMLKLERDRNDKLMAAERAPAADPNSLIGLAGLLTPLLGKMKPTAITSIVNGVMRVLNPREAPPESGWTPEAVMTMVNTAGPLLQTVLMPLVDAFRSAFTPAGAPSPQPATATVTNPPAKVIPITAATRPPVVQPNGDAPDFTLAPDEKMSMDLFFRFLGQEDYESAWGALGATEKTTLLNWAVLELPEGQSPQSLLPMFLKFDVRTNGQVGPISKYLEWAKTVQAPRVIAEEAAEEEAEKNGRGRNSMPGEEDRE